MPPRGFAFEGVDFSGVRGKGVHTLVLLPLRLLKAFWQSLAVLRRLQPDVVVGFGGYITFPAGLMAALTGKPLLLHEQGLDEQICMKLQLLTRPADLRRWDRLVHEVEHPQREVTIAMCGKYTDLSDSYKSLNEALRHAGIHGSALAEEDR